MSKVCWQPPRIFILSYGSALLVLSPAEGLTVNGSPLAIRRQVRGGVQGSSRAIGPE